MSRIALAALVVIACGNPPATGGSGGGADDTGGGAASAGGGDAAAGGGDVSSSGGGDVSTGGGSSSVGGGASASGGGTVATGGGTTSTGGGVTGTGGGTTSTGGGATGTGGGTTSNGGGAIGTGGGHAAGGGSSNTGGGQATGGGSAGAGGGSTGSTIKKVFVIAFENQGTSTVYASSNAPYLNNTLMAQGGHASMYGDVLSSSTPSEPHYVWMEAGTNAFSDVTFTSDSDPSATNSTSSTAHLATQLTAAGKQWREYAEGIDGTTGACPIVSGNTITTYFAAKHDPFVFFQDIVGATPSKTAAGCTSHHRAYVATSFQEDLTNGDVADYTFITPDLCDDMHGAACLNGCVAGAGCVTAGDAWIQANVPAILTYINAHDGVLFLVWDEPATTGNQPFVVIGPHVKAGYTSTLSYTHSSYVKSLEKIFGVPVLSTVQSANDFSDFFQTDYFP